MGDTVCKDLIDSRRYADLTKVAALSARHVNVDEINYKVIE